MEINWLKRILIAFLFVPASVMAQDTVATVSLPRVYLGCGSGLNDLGAIGVEAELPIYGRAFGYFDLGLGSWGGIVGAGCTYYFDSFTKGSSFSAGLSHWSGLDTVKTKVTVEPDGLSQDVVMDRSPVCSLNLKYAYSFPLGNQRRNKLQLMFGYAMPLSKNNYTVLTPVVLDKEAKTTLGTMEPGGLLMGLKFMFGVGR